MTIQRVSLNYHLTFFSRYVALWICENLKYTQENLTEVLLLIKKTLHIQYNIIVEFNFVYFYYLCMSAYKYALTCMCKSKDNLKDSVLSFYQVDPGN